MKRSNISFVSEGTLLKGWLYEPANTSSTTPAVVMAHGFTSVKEQYLDKYAEVFCSEGFHVLVYDHANFGESEGTPRQEMDPVLQRRGYRDAITFLQSLPGIDPQRIGIWGTSLSGGHVIEVAAIDRRVKCVVAQVPSISGHESAKRRLRSDLVPAMLARYDNDRKARFAGAQLAIIAAVSDDPGVACAMVGVDSYEYFMNTRSFAPNWKNEVTLRSTELFRENEPGHFISRISPTPFLMIVGDNDLLTATDICLTAYEKALEPKKLVMIKGGHFTPYVEHFKVTSEAAASWFNQHLNT